MRPQPDRTGPAVPSSPALDERRVKIGFVLLMVAAAWLFGWGIWSYALWDPWEPKYALAIREMTERDDMITPFLNGKIRWTKPILIYWAMAVPVKIFGNNELAVRLPSVLAALFGVWAVFYAVRRLRGSPTAFAAAGILVTIPQYFYLARQATPDMLLVGFLAATMGFLALARFQEDRREIHLAAFWACLSLAFLTKGPLAPVLTLWSSILFLLPEFELRWLLPAEAWKRIRHVWSSYRCGRGLLIFTAISGPWYVAMLVKHRWEFIDSFILNENLERFATPLFGHDGIASRYVTTLFHGTFPWIGLLLVGLLFVFHAGGRDEETRQRWFFLCWLIGGFTMFTIASTKLDHYLLPVIPAVAVLIAIIWESWWRRENSFWVGGGLLLSVLFTFLSFRDFVFEENRLIMSVFSPAQEIVVMERGIEITLWILLGAWALVMALAWWRRGALWVAILAFVVAYSQGVYFCHVVIPAHTPERSLKIYADEFSRIAEPDAELVFYGWIRNSIRYYHPGEMAYFEPDQLDEMVDYVNGRPNVYIIGQELFFDDMLDELHHVTRERWTTVSSAHPVFDLITNSNRKRLRSADR